jgi:cytochrome c-type biogenesis protein CcmH
MKFPPKRTLFAGGTVLFLSFLVPLLPIGAQTTQSTLAPNDPNEAAFYRISNRVMCQCGGCTNSAGTCNHIDCASATYIRNTIRRSLNEGKTEQTILASFVEQYGPRILPEPPREGFSLLGWIMPFAALLLGGGAVTYVLLRWKMEPVPDEPATLDGEGGTAGLGLPAAAPGNELVEKYRIQIERELEKE